MKEITTQVQCHTICLAVLRTAGGWSQLCKATWQLTSISKLFLNGVHTVQPAILMGAGNWSQLEDNWLWFLAVPWIAGYTMWMNTNKIIHRNLLPLRKHTSVWLSLFIQRFSWHKHIYLASISCWFITERLHSNSFSMAVQVSQATLRLNVSCQATQCLLPSNTFVFCYLATFVTYRYRTVEICISNVKSCAIFQSVMHMLFNTVKIYFRDTNFLVNSQIYFLAIY